MEAAQRDRTTIASMLVMLKDVSKRIGGGTSTQYQFFAPNGAPLDPLLSVSYEVSNIVCRRGRQLMHFNQMFNHLLGFDLGLMREAWSKARVAYTKLS